MSGENQNLISIHEDFHESIEGFKSTGDIVEIQSEGNLTKEIHTYVTTHRESILDHLGENGKILIPMNSAEKFADIVVKLLGLPASRVVKFKVSTYADGVSQKRSMTPEEDIRLKTALGFEKGIPIFIIEDLIDTGHTLNILYDSLNNNGDGNVKILCLLDKNIPESKSIRERLGDKLASILDIGPEFVIGFGMDYDYQLGADIGGLWKIKEGSIPRVTKALNFFTSRVRDIL